MSTTIFYYTGTGNSLWVARLAAAELGGSELVSISEKTIDLKLFEAETIGLVFPVHIWGVPGAMVRFTERLQGIKPDYIFAYAVNGGQVSSTLLQLENILLNHGLSLSAGFEIKTPSNYIPWGGPGPKEKQNNLFELARAKISMTAPAIKAKVKMPLEKGPLWQRILFTAIYKLSFSRVPKMDKGFRADEKCNGCEICYKICPASNITMVEGKPNWNNRCQQCFACLQWCPQEAIQYGKRTTRFERYHHPEIKLKDILQS